MNSLTITDHGDGLGAAPGQLARVVVVPVEHGVVQVAQRGGVVHRGDRR